MLTVDFDRLDLREGHRLLDMGCGGGRHAFAAMRRGATVVALDYDAAELKEVRATRGAMIEAGEIAPDAPGGEVNGDALRLPFADATFDRIIASEVLEHLWDDRGAIFLQNGLYHIARPAPDLLIDTADVFTDQTNAEQNHPHQEERDCKQCENAFNLCSKQESPCEQQQEQCCGKECESDAEE